jgi:hypothetical protein
VNLSDRLVEVPSARESVAHVKDRARDQLGETIQWPPMVIRHECDAEMEAEAVHFMSFELQIELFESPFDNLFIISWDVCFTRRRCVQFDKAWYG